MKIELARPGALIVDSEPFSVGGTLAEALAIRATGVDAMFVYLGAITAERLGFIHQAGMAAVPVTFGRPPAQWNADQDLAEMRSLAIPIGATPFLDIEGKQVMAPSPTNPNGAPFAFVQNAAIIWATKMASAGEIPGGYFAPGSPFTSLEMWKLPFRRYWRGQGRIVDRRETLPDGSYALAEPTNCGWCMTQSFPSHLRGGVYVDAQIAGQDYLGRGITWIVA